ncbi:hypothetical protein F2Q68_00031931 [Brassica cretica]|uniref:Uncharacterized protein n=1 Tax=Brassica cretica TaxID=69181 RepID=A0A8S9GGP3_BRACR|nr:hypothetical protein F2Q68_00031931 [Brassica cretica]
MEVVSSHLELYWRSYDRFTRSISTLTQVGRRGLVDAGAWTKSWTRGCTAGSVPRVSLPGRPYQKLDDGLTRVGRCGLSAMTPTRVASLPWPKINLFKGHFRFFYGNH